MADEKIPEVSSASAAVPPPTTTSATEKEAVAPTATQDVEASAAGPGTVPDRPAGWKYRSYYGLPYYASPATQLLIVSFVCFLCPGMFNALSGTGGGGQVKATTADNANVALYSTFAPVGFFAGTLVNRLGVRITLSFGGIGYFIYASSFLAYNHTQDAGYTIFAGALLGVSAGLLWAAQGTVMLSYPTEASKGRYIAWFWMIFNLGGVIGALIPLGQNIHSTSGSVSDGTYIGFMILMFLGAMLALCLVSAKEVIRKDGSRVILMKHPTWQSEIFGLWETLRLEPFVIALFPMFFASNVFYTYHFNDYNLPKFDIRTRALNNVLYWSSQIIGAFSVGYFLDLPQLKRSLKAKIILGVLFVLTMVIWGGGWAFQKTYTRAEADAADFIKLDWNSPGYVGPMFLYMFYAFYDAAWQTSVYWLIGSLTNNSRRLVNYVGFYKGIQSAAAVIFFRIDALGAPYAGIFGGVWGLLAGSLVIAAPVFWFKIRDTVPLEEDLEFSDETVEDVLGGKAVSVEENEVHHDASAPATEISEKI
ncbi:hypothetical protein MMC25_000265 [Agyrium rufum]|nr:hypothetical protein [Agyrium rufum]